MFAHRSLRAPSSPVPIPCCGATRAGHDLCTEASRRRLVVAVRIAVFGVLMASASIARAGELPGVELFAPPPTWVDLGEVKLDPPRRDHGYGPPVRVLLHDVQALVVPGRRELFVRQSVLARGRAGADAAGHLTIPFDPSDYTLHLHSVHRVRAGERRELTREVDLQLAAASTSSVSAVSAERVLHAFVPSIRDGDIVEYALTSRGLPAPGDEWPDFAIRLAPSDEISIERLRVRLLGPRSRPISYAARGLRLDTADIRELPEYTEYRWDLRRPTISDYRSLGGPHIAVTAAESWAQIARVIRSYYEPRIAAAAGVSAVADRWRGLPELARATAAVRFVQDDVRYVSLPIGPHKWIPEDAASVLERELGDCKDKAVLLVALLRELGIAADPALVDLEGREGIPLEPPTRTVFDHAIVRAQIDGRAFWIDPTQTFRRGAMTPEPDVSYRHALVLAEDTTDLESVPEPTLTRPDVEVVERLGRPYGAARSWEIEMTARGRWAAEIRRALDRGEDCREVLGERLRRGGAGVSDFGMGRCRVDESPDGSLTLAAGSAPGVFAYKAEPAGHRLWSMSIAIKQAFAALVSGERTGRSQWVRHELQIGFPFGAEFDEQRETVDLPGGWMTISRSERHGLARLVGELRVEAADVPVTHEATSILSLRVKLQAVQALLAVDPPEQMRGSLAAASGAFGVLLALGVWGLRDRLRRSRGAMAASSPRQQRAPA